MKNEQGKEKPSTNEKEKEKAEIPTAGRDEEGREGKEREEREERYLDSHVDGGPAVLESDPHTERKRGRGEERKRKRRGGK